MYKIGDTYKEKVAISTNQRTFMVAYIDWKVVRVYDERTILCERNNKFKIFLVD